MQIEIVLNAGISSLPNYGGEITCWHGEYNHKIPTNHIEVRVGGYLCNCRPLLLFQGYNSMELYELIYLMARYKLGVFQQI